MAWSVREERILTEPEIRLTVVKMFTTLHSPEMVAGNSAI